MELETIRRICLSRHLFELGSTSLRSKNDLHLFSAVNLLQDAVEAFLVAVSDHVNAKVDQNTKFDKYFSLIEEKIAPKDLPFKNKLLRLNRMRVDSKHHGIQPSRDECERVILSVREFFDEVSDSIFSVDFGTVSTLHLIEEGSIKNLLETAKQAYESRMYKDCLIACRKVIYLQIERGYDAKQFAEQSVGGIFAFTSKVPMYARDHKYLASYVRNPTDFIITDTSRVNEELLTKGVDTTAFWNVCRLTPKLYLQGSDEWVVKSDFNVLDVDGIQERAEYVFSATVDIALAIQASNRAVQWHGFDRYTAKLAKANVSVYEKADRSSVVVAVTPDFMNDVLVDFHIMGLKNDDFYWYVVDTSHDIYGYVHNDDIVDPNQSN